MHYYIDGYNLLFRSIREVSEVSSYRQSLIMELHHKIGVVGLDATLVFDAQYFPGGREKANFDNLEIIFSAEGETADQWILNAVQQSKRPLEETVVTSDKKLAWYVRRKAARTLSIEEFMDLLNRRYRNKLKEQLPKTEIKPKSILPKKTEKGSNDYYLQVFEEEFTKLNIEKPKKKRKIEVEKPLMDIERWLKNFERNLEEGEEM